jgi:hypothetical protein
MSAPGDSDGGSPGPVPDHDSEQLVGRVGGALRIGTTVHRPTGPWTPAVHALLDHLSPRLPCVPRVLGTDDEGREVLDHLPGTVIDLQHESLTDRQLRALVTWTAAFHEAVADFTHPGPWRHFPVPRPTLIGHNDIAAYNACFDGDDLAGVFDWDLAGPSNPLAELAFIAWNGVPLTRALPPEEAARRLDLITSAYGSGPTPRQVLAAVPWRIRIMIEGVPRAAAAGDEGMRNLVRLDAPAQARQTLTGLEHRIPAILAALG